MYLNNLTLVTQSKTTVNFALSSNFHLIAHFLCPDEKRNGLSLNVMTLFRFNFKTQKYEFLNQLVEHRSKNKRKLKIIRYFKCE